jgi:hypothetical protein
MKKYGVLLVFMGLYILIATGAVYGQYRRANEKVGLDLREVSAIEDNKEKPSAIERTTLEQSTGEDDTTTQTTIAMVSTTEATTQVQKEATIETKTPVQYVYTVIDTDYVNLRQDGSCGKVIGWIPRGATGKVLSIGETYSYVEYNNKMGYVSNTYLEIEKN